MKNDTFFNLKINSVKIRKNLVYPINKFIKILLYFFRNFLKFFIFVLVGKIRNYFLINIITHFWFFDKYYIISGLLLAVACHSVANILKREGGQS